MNKDIENFYVTTPIYYVNDKPHIGHAYTTIIADIFARYHRKIKGKENVFFLTGTDEHGSKVARSAEAHHLSPQEFVDKISEEYKNLWRDLNISHDEFFRTTNPEHKRVVQNYLQQLYDNGYIYKGEYKGLYCIGCEKFLPFDEIVNNACIYHPNTKLVEQEEKNYFFKLKDFSSLLSDKIKKGDYKILPKGRENEILSKINEGINDVSVSRPGVSWGIPLPWDSSQTVYVWIDALLNYYSATKIYPEKEKFWPASLHLMAKDILWFHAFVWESLLLANKIKLPKTVFAHGFFTVNGQKMSKTIGNVIDPHYLIKTYGSDATRYLLASSFSFGNDGDISLEKFETAYNANLVNGLGNLTSRIMKMAETYGIKPELPNKPENLLADFMENYRINEAIDGIWKEISETDKYIQDKKPFSLIKTDEAEAKKIIGELVVKLWNIAVNLEIFLPETAEKIKKCVRENKMPETPLFPRI
jgi:methionyl-tRNA synthetase